MNSVQYLAEGTLFNIQRYSLHDGPGIRTIAFFKGCPLACRWCSNPESQNHEPELMYNQADCIHCSRCIDICEENAISLQNPAFIDRDLCVMCGSCSEVCPTGAISVKGRCFSVGEVIQELKKEESLFRRSGGGVTLSGGEPLAQPEFARELLKACKAQGWHTAIETTGCAPAEVIESVFPFVDLALTDVKAINPEVHQNNTSVDNRLILENLIRISFITRTVVRIPLVPGVNDNDAEIEAIAGFARMMNKVESIHLLPYHTYGENKYTLLGREYPMSAGLIPVTDGQLEHFCQIIRDHGFTCHTGG